MKNPQFLYLILLIFSIKISLKYSCHSTENSSKIVNEQKIENIKYMEEDSKITKEEYNEIVKVIDKKDFSDFNRIIRESQDLNLEDILKYLMKIKNGKNSYLLQYYQNIDDFLRFKNELKFKIALDRKQQKEKLNEVVKHKKNTLKLVATKVIEQQKELKELEELEKAENIGIVVILLKIEFCKNMEEKYKNKEKKVLKKFCEETSITNKVKDIIKTLDEQRIEEEKKEKEKNDKIKKGKKY